jgi:hypothetical protein
VLLVSESAGLAAVLSRLLGRADRLGRLGSLGELAEGLDGVDLVVLDLPAADRVAALGQLREQYLGPVVALVARGDDRRVLRRDEACRMLTRPFSAEELASALAVPSTRRTAADDDVPRGGAPGVGPAARTDAIGPTLPATSGRKPVDPKAAARQAPVRPQPVAAAGGNDLVGRIQRLLVAVTQGWRAQRRIRLAGFSAFALVAFTVAFALAAQGRCGPGCDAIGVKFSPAPSVAPAESRAPTTSKPKRPVAAPKAAPVTSAAAGGAYRGVVSADEPTTTTRRATTTTRRPSPGGGGGTVTTRPPTSAPTTTATTLPTTTVATTQPTVTP